MWYRKKPMWYWNFSATCLSDTTSEIISNRANNNLSSQRTHQQNFSLWFEVNLLKLKVGAQQRKSQPLSISGLVLNRADLLRIEGRHFGGGSLGSQIIYFSKGFEKVEKVDFRPLYTASTTRKFSSSIQHQARNFPY
jgi:hypothetical protein